MRQTLFGAVNFSTHFPSNADWCWKGYFCFDGSRGMVVGSHRLRRTPERPGLRSYAGAWERSILPEAHGLPARQSLDQGIDIPFLSRAWPAPTTAAVLVGAGRARDGRRAKVVGGHRLRRTPERPGLRSHAEAWERSNVVASGFPVTRWKAGPARRTVRGRTGIRGRKQPFGAEPVGGN